MLATLPHVRESLRASRTPPVSIKPHSCAEGAATTGAGGCTPTSSDSNLKRSCQTTFPPPNPGLISHIPPCQCYFSFCTVVQKAGWKESPYCQHKQEQAPSHTLPCSLRLCTHSVGLLWERHEGLLEQPQLKEERRNQSHTAGMQLLQLL